MTSTTIKAVALGVAAALAAAVFALVQPAGASGNVYATMNDSGGLYWRSGPDYNTAIQQSGYGVYPGTYITVNCYQMGAANVPGSSDAMWVKASWYSGPGTGSGWINEHFINDGQPVNQAAPGVPPCSSSGGGSSGGGGTTTITIRGGTSCSYHPVVGVWVQSSTGGSKFASWSKASPGGYSAGFSASITVNSLPTNIQIHTGCGGTSQSWWSDNWTSSLSTAGSRTGDSLCNEGTSQPAGGANTRCSWQSVASVIVAAASTWSGQHYCWDGGTQTGPSHGAGNYNNEAPACVSSSVSGFDCTGLTIYAVFHATDILLPHGVGQQNYGTRITSTSALQPGDIVFFGGSLSNFQHAAVYAGSGMVWDANTAFGPYGDGVTKRSMSWELPFVGASRF